VGSRRHRARAERFWVFEANAQARAFYEALGGIVVRTQPIDIAGQTLTEVAYGWPNLSALLRWLG
jgi:hypothetical protein